MATYRILSLDGGGIRGIVSVVLMQRLAAERGLSRFLAGARLVAGTSTGGLIALGLAHEIDLAELRDLYETRGKAIFDTLLLSYRPGPGCPEPFYRKLGFVPTGRMDGDEVVLALPLARDDA